MLVIWDGQRAYSAAAVQKEMAFVLVFLLTFLFSLSFYERKWSVIENRISSKAGAFIHIQG